MANKLFEIIVASVTASNYEELTRPVLSNIKEYKYDIEAASAEEAEDLAIKKLVNNESLFDKQTQFAVVVETKMKDGTQVVYAKNDQYRKLARELRKFRMWPYLERCKEMTRDYCVYKGVSVEEAAKYIASDPGICSSPNRDIQGNELNVVQQIYAKVHKENAIRYENALNGVEKSSKTENNNNAKHEKLYPDAGLERYHQANPEVTKELAKQSKPETTVNIATSATLANDIASLPQWRQRAIISRVFTATGKKVEIADLPKFIIKDDEIGKAIKAEYAKLAVATVNYGKKPAVLNLVADVFDKYDITIKNTTCRIWIKRGSLEGYVRKDDSSKPWFWFTWNQKYQYPAVYEKGKKLSFLGHEEYDLKEKKMVLLLTKEESRNRVVVMAIYNKLKEIMKNA